MNTRRWIASIALLAAIGGGGAGLVAWTPSAPTPAAPMPEPAESVVLAVAEARTYRPMTTALGTVVALRSVTLRNELPGTVQEVLLSPGQVVDGGSVLVRLDVSVEAAELKAQEAQAALAESHLGRTERAFRTRSVSASELDRARAERDVAQAQVERIKAVIARKTIRAPFRARVGLSDVHPGQYLEGGAPITTLQGVADGAHVDFAVSQEIAASLAPGDAVEVSGRPATVVAIDARVDPLTRHATVRARIGGPAPSPGASVRVRVPAGPERPAVAVPANALRKGPGGDHVYVVAPGPDGKPRASVRRVTAGDLLGDEILIESGLTAGEQVAATGSFKLRDGVLVAANR